jgi:hypothetical protein
VLCQNPERDRHEISEGARKIDVDLRVDWGADDQRSGHAKTVSFCSFACLAEWAAGRAAEHDAHVLVEGDPAGEAI